MEATESSPTRYGTSNLQYIKFDKSIRGYGRIRYEISRLPWYAYLYPIRYDRSRYGPYKCMAKKTKKNHLGRTIFSMCTRILVWIWDSRNLEHGRNLCAENKTMEWWWGWWHWRCLDMVFIITQELVQTRNRVQRSRGYDVIEDA